MGSTRSTKIRRPARTSRRRSPSSTASAAAAANRTTASLYGPRRQGLLAPRRLLRVQRLCRCAAALQHVVAVGNDRGALRGDNGRRTAGQGRSDQRQRAGAVNLRGETLVVVEQGLLDNRGVGGAAGALDIEPAAVIENDRIVHVGAGPGIAGDVDAVLRKAADGAADDVHRTAVGDVDAVATLSRALDVQPVEDNAVVRADVDRD